MNNRVGQHVKDPRRQWQGAVSKANGEIFEQYIETACEYYRMKKLAVIEKTPEPMRPIKSLGKGKFIAHFEKQAQPDYKGSLADGKAIVFEAKHTDKDRIEQNRLTDEQVSALGQYFNMGAKCFVIVSLGMQSFYRVPWEIWRDMKAIYKRKYMTKEELEKFRVPIKNGIIMILDEVRS